MFERNCPVCGETKFEPFLKPPKSPGPVVRCSSCSFIFVNPIEKPDALILEGPMLYDRPERLLTSCDKKEIAGSWEEGLIRFHMKEEAAKIRNAQEVLAQIAAFKQEPGKILDIGSFCGVFLHAAAGLGWESFGIEPLVMPAIYARAEYGLTIVTDTLHRDTFPEESFDVVTAFQVFEHLVYPAEEMAMIADLLKPSGLLVIEVPNIATPAVSVFGSRHRHFVQDHVSFFSSETLQKLLFRLDFTVRKIYYPSRVMSLRHFFDWIAVYRPAAGKIFKKRLPPRILDLAVRINLKDILTVIAEKPCPA